MKLLIADDSATSREALCQAVSRLEVTVVEARDGDQAWEILSQPDPPRIAILDWMMPGLSGPEICALLASGGREPFIYTILLTSKDGSQNMLAALEAGAHVFLSKPVSSDELLGHLGVARRLVENDDQLKEIRQRQSDIIDFLPDPTVVLDSQGRVTNWNRACERLTGVPAAEILGRGDYAAGQAFYGKRRPILADLVNDPDLLETSPYTQVERQGQRLVAETFVPGLKEAGVHLWGNAQPLFDPAGHQVGAIEVIRDITDRKRMEERLRTLATVDSLTGLYNRRHFLELTEREIGRSLRYASPLAVVMLDLDEFKKVNDSFGHAGGDEAIKVLAVLAQDELRESDYMGRLGGEEFCITLVECDLKNALQVAERIRRVVEDTPVECGSQSISLTLSAGVAAMDPEGEELSELLLRADQALYAAKDQGRNRVVAAQPPKE